MLIDNVLVFDNKTGFSPGKILINGDKIESVLRNGSDNCMPGNGINRIDGKGGYAIPGLIDMHLHGCNGIDYGRSDDNGITVMAEYLLRRGITSFVPALMAQPIPLLERSCRLTAGYLNKSGADLVGLNMEALFISASRKGAQDEEHIKVPDIDLFRSLQDKAGGLVKIVGVAPEIDGTMEFIDEFCEDVVISLAHTEADYETAKEAFDRGARSVTHLFNAMQPFHHRNPGVIGAALERQNSFVEMICDGIFVHPTVMKAVFKMFGEHRVVLISDSIPATGCGDGLYRFSGEEIIVKNSVGYKASDNTMVGPAIDLFEGFRRAVISAQIPLEQAVRSVTDNPARALGIQDRYGSISEGKIANLLLLDKDLNLNEVIFHGELINGNERKC